MRKELLLLLPLTAIACSETGIGERKDVDFPADAHLIVSPLALDFGISSIDDEPVIRTFTITSVGEDPALISNVDIQGEDAGSFSIVGHFEEQELAPGDSIDIQVAFIPTDRMSDNFTEAVVFSNDEDYGAIPVSLVGAITEPDLLITPAPLNFGATYVGCNMPNEITLSNIGTDDLELYSIGEVDAPFTVDGIAQEGLVLAPGESFKVDADFAPDLETTYTGGFEVESNDPDGVQHVAIQGIGMFMSTLDQEWVNPAQSPTDILFVLDRSGSMQDDLDVLAANFDTFINELSNHASDWQVMVVTDDDGCSNYSGILTPNTPNYQDLFTAGVSNGGNGGDIGLTERLVQMAQVAIDNTDQGECNAGFLRNNAMLHVIMVTDEKEHSPIPVLDMVNDIIAQKGGNADRVKMSAIYNPNDDLNERYQTAVTMTDGLLFDIHESSTNNWSSPENMALIAEASVIVDRYDLDQPAVESTIEVMVNGQTVEGNWYYDAEQQAVIFNDQPPGENDITNITYAALAECD